MKTRTGRNKKSERRGGSRKGLFITFEGIEGCGKTTQCQRLANLLRTKGYQVLETREPGGTPFAEQLRSLLLRDHSDKLLRQQLTPISEVSLVLASRAHHVTYKILPALSHGMVVLCDRFSDSTLAYQGYGRGLDLEKLQNFNELATEWLAPDHTFLFDLPVKQGLARKKKAGKQNRIDRESTSFHERVRKGFLSLAQLHPQRITVLDGQRSPEVIASEVAARTDIIIGMNLKSQPRFLLRRHRTPVTA